MDTVACSFCGASESLEVAKTRFVAGPEVFVCRDCVEIMIDVFARQDPQWAKERLKALHKSGDSKRTSLRRFLGTVFSSGGRKPKKAK